MVPVTQTNGKFGWPPVEQSIGDPKLCNGAGMVCLGQEFQEGCGFLAPAPTFSMANATSLQRRSGYVRSFGRLASWTAALAQRPVLVRGCVR